MYMEKVTQFKVLIGIFFHIFTDLPTTLTMLLTEMVRKRPKRTSGRGGYLDTF